MRALLLAVVVLLAACEPLREPSGGAGGVPDQPTGPRRHELTGGTLLTTPDGKLAAVTEADLDRVVLVDLTPPLSVRARIALPEGSHPGRMALDDAGDLHVVLRATGQVAKISLTAKEHVSTRDVCPDPRGIVWDAAAKVLRVACSSGFLAELPLDGAATLTRLEADLRDVLLTPAGVKVTTFRSAELLGLDGSRFGLNDLTMSASSVVAMRANVAWRTLVAADGTVVMANQRAVLGPVEALSPQAPDAGPAPGGSGSYGGGSTTSSCEMPVIRSMLTFIDRAGVPLHVQLSGVLPIDVALSPTQAEAAVALASSGEIEVVSLTSGTNFIWRCRPTGGFLRFTVGGFPSGIAYLPDGTIVVHRVGVESSLVLFDKGTVNASTFFIDALPSDPGRDFFHTRANNITCASCHPEGRDDGHRWDVQGLKRRTPSLAGGLLETAPFHWQGELASVEAVLDDTFVKRMGGVKPHRDVINRLASWMEGIPRPAPTADLGEAALARAAAGKALFEDGRVGCTQCHSGAALSIPGNFDVGTGGRFQVPSLRGVGARGPWLHDGYARTLRERFAVGGGDRHGTTSHLTPAQLDALTAYLETL